MSASPSKTESPIAEYRSYIAEVASLIERLHDAQGIENTAIENHLNGSAYEALRKLVPLEVRRENGIFFTSSEMAESVANKVKNKLEKGCTVGDPACGAGDLLVACAKHLPLKKTLKGTIGYWGKLICGNDIHEEFVNITKLKLLLVASARHKDYRIRKYNLNSCFERIVVADTLSDGYRGLGADCIVMNPPFSNSKLEKDYEWATGKTQVAAEFVYKVLVANKKCSDIVAILPDVLRSGTRYSRWRSTISSMLSEQSISVHGKFDENTDVDVFILNAKLGKGEANSDWVGINVKTDICVGDYYKVSVGSVVPHRDPMVGAWYRFVDSRMFVSWGVTESTKKRRYQGTVVEPPFVIVKRTSSPSDRYRACASIVSGCGEVAVENHLIVIRPKEGSLEACYKLINSLKDTRTNDWLNERIRCRHLTVTSLRDLPIWV